MFELVNNLNALHLNSDTLSLICNAKLKEFNRVYLCHIQTEDNKNSLMLNNYMEGVIYED